jgi:hypothetical protein
MCVIIDIDASNRFWHQLSGMPPNLAQFEHLEEHMVRTGDAGKQAVHVSAVREMFSRRRKLCSEGNEAFRAQHAR